MNQVKIGNFIKTLRKEKKLTQKELADYLGITDRAISKWERGLGCPDVSLLEDLSKYLGVSILELLKGERLEDKQNCNQKDLLKLINWSKENIIQNIQTISNYVTIFIIATICLIILITNIKSILFTTKKYDFSNDYLNDLNDIPVSKTCNELIEELNNKIEQILNNQGTYSNEDYSNMKTYMNTLKATLQEQANDTYCNQTNYTFQDLVGFYLKHQNLITYPLDNKKLYPIILSHNPTLSNNLISYSTSKASIQEIYFNLYSYLEQPYYLTNRLPYQDYSPNPYFIIKSIYTSELILVNDIIEAGDIK
jgi:DNA-binding XRE family transcriptional regulator